MASPTYGVSCPNCGATLQSSVAGPLLAACPSCPWFGAVTFQPQPHKASTGGGSGGSGSIGLLHGISFASLGALPPPPPVVATTETPPLEQNPLDARRDALLETLDDLRGAINDRLRELPEQTWAMKQWRRYERLQEAHESFYEALGERRMGAYRVNLVNLLRLDEALLDVVLWALLLLDGAEQPPTTGK